MHLHRTHAAVDSSVTALLYWSSRGAGCKDNDRAKDVIGEINDDIIAYSTRWKNLIFVVYDLGFIRDVDTFCSAFEAREGVIVRVVKH
jgi:hypothetical protein